MRRSNRCDSRKRNTTCTKHYLMIWFIFIVIAAFDRYDRYGKWSICSFDSIGSISDLKKRNKFKTPLLGELSRSSWDSFESNADSKESRDDRRSLPKSGYLHFLDFVVRRRRTSISTSDDQVPKMQISTFWRIKPIVSGFFRIGCRFERIPGRSA